MRCHKRQGRLGDLPVNHLCTHLVNRLPERPRDKVAGNNEKTKHHFAGAMVSRSHKHQETLVRSVWMASIHDPYKHHLI
jgi:hypothetical protein